MAALVDETNIVQDEVDFIKTRLGKHQTADGSLFLIESLDVGVIGTLRWCESGRSWESNGLDWILARSRSHGKGIMTRTVGALVDVLLVSCGFNRVVIETGVDNSASSGIPLRLGFREEGRSVQRQWMYDRWVDSFQYAITASEWRAKPNTN